MYTPANNKRLIDMPVKFASLSGDAGETARGGEAPAAGDAAADGEQAAAWAESRQIISDAQETAERILAQARDEADRLLAEAKSAVEAWWAERRSDDEKAVAEAAERGYREGFAQGRSEAEQRVQEQYAELIAEARSVLEQAYRHKETIIAEAEPFLVELSTAIASKVIGRQLTLEPQWVLEMVRSVLARRREQGVVSLCVAPQQYALVSDAKEDLQQALDPQAELLIVPDPSVEDHGCVIRTSFGSLDARVDTQLAEIKRALLALARSGEGDANP
jgi:flagellar assembly protein FliH